MSAIVTVLNAGTGPEDLGPCIEVVIPETPDLPGATVVVRFTREGIIVDGFQEGDLTATFSQTYDEFYGEMIR
jgi:hypothetical protein